MGRLYAPKQILKVDETGFDYLISAEMIVVDGRSRVGFVHQSILDYFISKRMMLQYFADKSRKISKLPENVIKFKCFYKIF
ncbi:hypothetical protein [Lacrimispora celerecrescens]|uniref:hypothetical protein n=1 Tax=Lacrimispora celerecrescens TaxID=29354 RepID=UPI00140C8D7C|nr:hypothetical protein [Lacrimispora celerecrescens]